MKILITTDADSLLASAMIPDAALPGLQKRFGGKTPEHTMTGFLELLALDLRGSLESQHVEAAVRGAADDFAATVWAKPVKVK